MRGLRIDFPKQASNKIKLDFSKSIDDFDSTTQNAVVNTITKNGSDASYTNKGTGLSESLLKGGMFASNAGHICNFAASDTLSFINASKSSNSDNIETFALELGDVDDSGNLDVFVVSKSTEGITSNLSFLL